MVPSVMKTEGVNMLEHYAKAVPGAARAQLGLRPSSLYLVNEHEMRALRGALARAVLPPDFEAKLMRLAEGDLIQRFVAQHCRLFTGLLLASYEGTFKEASATQCERLLRVLAYVRKDDDAIQDYKPGGFVDDQQEVRAAASELRSLLESFKAWRLRHQVPGMWSAPYTSVSGHWRVAPAPAGSAFL
jgi:hypothetical protein